MRFKDDPEEACEIQMGPMMDCTFLLLLYFIMTLGIRLDEISRAIGGPGGNPRPAGREADSLAAQLHEIRRELRRIRASLDKLSQRDAPDERPEP